MINEAVECKKSRENCNCLSSEDIKNINCVETGGKKSMAINTTQFEVSDLLKTIERQKLDELNERRKANGQELELIPEELMTEEELKIKSKNGE